MREIKAEDKKPIGINEAYLKEEMEDFNEWVKEIELKPSIFGRFWNPLSLTSKALLFITPAYSTGFFVYLADLEEKAFEIEKRINRQVLPAQLLGEHGGALLSLGVLMVFFLFAATGSSIMGDHEKDKK